MEVYIDEKKVDDEFSPDGTLEEAVREIQANVHQTGRMVIGIKCDGRVVDSVDMIETLKKQAPTINRLDVLTGTKEALVTDAMDQAATSLDETESASQRIAELLVEGKTNDAVKNLGDCLRVWQQIHEAIAKSMELLGVDADKLMVRDETLLEAICRPKDVLLQIRDALQAKDHVLLADILQYEFGDVTNTWHAIIARIRQQAEDQQPD